MRIRLYEPRDEGDVLRMVRELFVEDPSPHAPGDANVRRTLGVITDERRGAVWLADDDEGTAPFAYLFLTKVWSNELGGDLVFVDEIWVAPERRSRGVGTALIEHGIATTKGAVAFELEVSPGNPRARALYERLGFRPLRNASLRRVLGIAALAVAIFGPVGSEPQLDADFAVARRVPAAREQRAQILVLYADAPIDDRASLERYAHPVRELVFEPGAHLNAAISEGQITERTAVVQREAIGRAKAREIDLEDGRERELGLETELARAQREAIDRPPAQRQERAHVDTGVVEWSSQRDA
jgi:GNAT superfamily N-acetyltransferase